jgi:hypothetical protein
VSLLYVSYGVFKQIKTVGTVYYLAYSGGYVLYVGTDGTVHSVDISDLADVTDFETWKASCTAVASQGDGISLSICAPQGNVVPNPPIRQDGVVRVQLEPGDVARRMMIQGFDLTATNFFDSGTSQPGKTSVEIDWTTTVLLQGIDGIWCKYYDDRDYMEMYAVLEAGVDQATFEALTGQAWPFGGATTTPVDIDLFCFGKDVYVPLDGKIRDLVAEGSFTVPPFIKLRLDYYTFIPPTPANAPIMRGLLRIWV